MNVHPIAAIAELIGDRARAEILTALLDGKARTAGELAFTANISAQSASGHLSKMLDGGLLVVRNAGRHRYYSLTGPDVAHALEALGCIATKPQTTRPINERTTADLRLARTCYDHLAGRIAVEVAANLQTEKVIRPHGKREFQLGPHGERWLAEFGIDVQKLRQSRRCFARQHRLDGAAPAHCGQPRGGALCKSAGTRLDGSARGHPIVEDYTSGRTGVARAIWREDARLGRIVRTQGHFQLVSAQIRLCYHW